MALSYCLHSSDPLFLNKCQIRSGYQWNHHMWKIPSTPDDKNRIWLPTNLIFEYSVLKCWCQSSIGWKVMLSWSFLAFMSVCWWKHCFVIESRRKSLSRTRTLHSKRPNTPGKSARSWNKWFGKTLFGLFFAESWAVRAISLTISLMKKVITQS